MQQDIPLGGISAATSGYECADGELAISANAIYEDKHVHPIMQPKALFALTSGDRLLCIHKTAKFCHHIALASDGEVCYYQQDGDTYVRTDSGISLSDKVVTGATPLGNTITFRCADGIHYLLWTTSTGESGALQPRYIYIDALPELNLSFGLHGTIKQKTTEILTIHSYDDEQPIRPNSEGWQKITDAVMAKINFMLAEAKTWGRFSMPFLVRYAYRLYDGSLTMHSSPILMMPSSTGIPMVALQPMSQSEDTGWQDRYCTFDTYVPSCVMDVATVNTADEIADIKSLSDIIQSVDIFVSAPFYGYNQDGKCSAFAEYESQGMGVMQMDCYTDYSDDKKEALSTYSRRTDVDEIQICHKCIYDYMVTLPAKEASELNDEIQSCSDFRLIKSLSLNDLYNARIDVEIDKDVLTTLNVRESMTDDTTNSHSAIVAAGGMEYNQRMMLYDIERTPFSGYYNQTFVDGLWSYEFSGARTTRTLDSVSNLTDSVFKVYRLITEIHKDGENFVVLQDCKSISTDGETTYDYIMLPSSAIVRSDVPNINMLLYYYYPSAGAYHAYFIDAEVGMVEIDVAESDTLVGSLFHTANDEYFEIDTRASIHIPTLTTTRQSYPNRIYVSEVGNPFMYDAASVVAVGNCSVLGIGTTAQALSQGQFGSFPLYAFTSEGIWALQVSSNGVYTAVQPISRDVCVNPQSITQLDGAIVFVTNRGLMMIEGSNIVCMTDIIRSLSAGDIVSRLKASASNLYTIAPVLADFAPLPRLQDYLADCLITYDYTNQHLVVYNTAYPFAWVYSFKSNLWGMMQHNLSYSIEAYTDTISVDANGNVRTFNSDESSVAQVAIVTRPLKLQYPNDYKSIHTLMVRGLFDRPHTNDSGIQVSGDVKVLLFGSNDLANWRPVASSVNQGIRNLHGSAYKYYIVVALADSLSLEKTLATITIDSELRHANNIH